MHVRSILSGLGAAAILLVGISFAGCGQQGEGERCSRDNNDEDCQPGMTCITPIGGTSSAQVCCPPIEQATTPECKRTVTTTDTGAPETTPPTDTGTSDADAPGESSVDSTTESGSDASDASDASDVSEAGDGEAGG